LKGNLLFKYTLKFDLILTLRPTQENYENISLSNWEDLFWNPRFDVERKTVFYFYGFYGSVHAESVSEISRAHLSRNDHNFVVIEWSDYTRRSFLDKDGAPRSVKKVSRNNLPFCINRYELEISKLCYSGILISMQA
jgi:hypothetical protein